MKSVLKAEVNGFVRKRHTKDIFEKSDQGHNVDVKKVPQHLSESRVGCSPGLTYGKSSKRGYRFLNSSRAMT